MYKKQGSQESNPDSLMLESTFLMMYLYSTLNKQLESISLKKMCIKYPILCQSSAQIFQILCCKTKTDNSQATDKMHLFHFSLATN